jgi:hypothetical protein
VLVVKAIAPRRIVLATGAGPENEVSKKTENEEDAFNTLKIKVTTWNIT